MNFGFVAPMSSIEKGIQFGFTRIRTSGVENFFFVSLMGLVVRTACL